MFSKQLVFFIFSLEPIFIRSQLFSVWTVCSLFEYLHYIALPDNIDLMAPFCQSKINIIFEFWN